MVNKKIYVGIGITILALGLVLLFSIHQKQSSLQNEEKPAYIDANNILKQKLAEYAIQMSSPIRLNKSEDIKKYCSFFKDEEKQKLVQYCTSSELKNKNDEFVGNIHMVGTSDAPKVVLSLIQTDPTMSQIDIVKTVFDTTVQSLVCDCWAEKKPGNLKNMGDWVDGLRQFHTNGTKPHSKSTLLTLEGKSLQLELTTNENGYLWQLYLYY